MVGGFRELAGLLLVEALFLLAVVFGPGWLLYPVSLITAGGVVVAFFVITLAAVVSLTGDRWGRPLLVNVWATWCPPCRVEMPAIEAAYQRYRDRGFTVLAVNQMEPQADVADFARELGLSFPIVLDSRGSVSRLYRVRALPTTFFIGRDGMIHDVLIGGPMSESLIESKLVPMLDDEGEG